jgi:hypothetical protein
MLVLDCETTTDEVQRLTFGWARHLLPRTRATDRYSLAGFEVAAEWCFYGDDLPPRDPAGFEVLQSRVAALAEQAQHPVHLLSREEFMNGPFRAIAFRGQALVIGFNLMFDLPRLAARCGIARARLPRVRGEDGELGPERFSRFTGGFSLLMFTYRDTAGREREDRWAPRLLMKKLMPGRNLVAFGSPRRVSLDPDDLRPADRGHFLDCHTLAFALASRRLSLAGACELFGVAEAETKAVAEQHGVINPTYIDYGRQDVVATAALALHLLQEFDSHPISPAHVYRGKSPKKAAAALGGRRAWVEPDPVEPRPNRAATLQATRAYSPASVGKGYLQYMKVAPVLERQPDFPTDLLGLSMGAFFGGRSEVRIRYQPVPVVLLDFLSMYPTVNALMRNWELLVAPRIEVVDALAEVQELVRQVAVAGPAVLLSPDAWRLGCTVCEVLPEGERLPVRTTWGATAGSYGIGVNPLWSARALPYMLPDVLAAALLSGRAPQVVSARRLVPAAPAAGQRATRSLRTTQLAGRVWVNPAKSDFFRAVIEERKRLPGRADLGAEDRERLSLFLKILANATSYGVFAQTDRQELPPDARVAVEVTTGGAEGTFEASTSAPETPGRFCFPPVAAAITAGARLMLAVAERLVSDRGGTFAFMDTDSLAVVATEGGGLVACPGGPERLPGGEAAIQALSFEQVEAVRGRFAELNPYDRAVVPGSILQVEPRCLAADGGLRSLTCLAISAKRYVLADPDSRRPVSPAEASDDEDEDVEEWAAELGSAPDTAAVAKRSEHGLGGYLAPDPHWIDQFWVAALAAAESGQRPRLPAWARQPAMRQLTVSTASVLRGFERLNRSRPAADRIRPGTFVIAPQVLEPPAGVDSSSFRLIGAYERDPRKWLRQRWLNLHPTRLRAIEELEGIRSRQEAAADAAEVWADLRSRVMDAGGLRPDRDYPAREIPAAVRRRSGPPADELAQTLNFASADELVGALQAAWAAYQRTRERLTRAPGWEELPPGQEFSIATGELEIVGPELARVATFGEVLAKYLRHSEAKSLAPDGSRCTGYTRGLLLPRPVRAGEVRFIGKEANGYEEVSAGVVASRESVVNEYRPVDAPDQLWEAALPVLQEQIREHLAGEVGTDRRHLRRLLQGRMAPGPELRWLLLVAAEQRALADLGEQHREVARSHREAELQAVLTRWTAWRAAAPSLCRGCGQPLSSTDPRRTHHSAACRDLAYNQRQRERASVQPPREAAHA